MAPLTLPILSLKCNNTTIACPDTGLLLFAAQGSRHLLTFKNHGMDPIDIRVETEVHKCTISLTGTKMPAMILQVNINRDTSPLASKFWGQEPGLIHADTVCVIFDLGRAEWRHQVYKLFLESMASVLEDNNIMYLCDEEGQAALKKVGAQEMPSLAPETIIVTWSKHDHITIADYNRLEREWLNDELINWGMHSVLQDGVKTHPPLAESLRLLSTFFMTKLRGEQGPVGVFNWTKGFDIFSMEYIVIPVNHDNKHWYLIIVADPELCLTDGQRQTEIYTLDSMSGFDHADDVKLVRAWLTYHAKHKRNVPNIQPIRVINGGKMVIQQPNGDDCGIYVIHYFKMWLTRPKFYGEVLAARKYDGNISDLWKQQEVTCFRQDLRRTLQRLAVRKLMTDMEVTRPVVDESESEVEIVQALNTRLRLQDTAGEPSS